MEELITVSRNCDATLIPSGEKIKLIKGTHVKITQALGGDYTIYVNGNLMKLSGKDADAIGKKVEVIKQSKIDKIPDNLDEDLIWEQLKTCYDPEIPVNIVDLGLIYDLKIEKSKKGFSINVKMTLTAPGCGMGPSIAQDAENKIRTINGVSDVLIELVWEPLWNQEMMTEDAKLKLGML